MEEDNDLKIEQKPITKKKKRVNYSEVIQETKSFEPLITQFDYLLTKVKEKYDYWISILKQLGVLKNEDFTNYLDINKATTLLREELNVNKTVTERVLNNIMVRSVTNKALQSLLLTTTKFVDEEH
jgi:hypothetical protein